MRDLSSFQITSPPVRVLHLPVPADEGEQVFRGCVCGGEAGEVEDGLGPGAPLALLLVRDVPLDEDGLVRVLEPGAGGQDADGAGLDPPRLISLVAAAAGVFSQSSAFSSAFRFGWLPRMGHSQCAAFAFRRNRELSRFACMASLVTTVPTSGSGASSGLKWLISFALPALATLSWAITIPGTWVTAASRCTFLFWPYFAPLRSLR